MSTAATVYRFRVELSDIDRGVYESLDERVACHPSEDEERMVVRMLARTLAHEQGLEFGRGLSNVDDAALWVQGGAGEIPLWIDVGMPTAERLHRASKQAERLMVVTHKPEAALRKEWSSRTIHRADRIELLLVPPQVVRELAQNMARSVTWYVTVQDGMLSVAEGERNLQGELRRMSLQGFLRTPQ